MFFGTKYALIRAISLVFTALWWIVLIDVILTWVPQVDRRHPIVVIIRRITEPLYRPIRNIVPPIRMGAGAIDITPVILLLLLSLLQRVLIGVVRGL